MYGPQRNIKSLHFDDFRKRRESVSNAFSMYNTAVVSDTIK